MNTEIQWKVLAEKVDSQRMIALLESFPDQIAEAERLGAACDLSRLSTPPRSVIFVGMGGSAMAGDLMSLLGADFQTVPLEVVRSYSLPHWVGPNTLVVGLSYSGQTEETLTAFQEARRRGADVLAVTSGGQLAAFCERENLPCLRIPNGRPPRTALGYLFIPLLLIFHRLGIFSNLREALDECLALSRKKVQEFCLESEEAANPAKQVALKLWKRLPVFYASTHLAPVALRWKAQINENAKQHAFWNVLPEMNHNEIVGWQMSGQEAVRKYLQPVFLQDSQELPPLRRRLKITERILREKGFEVIQLKTEGRSRLARIFSLILWADFTSYYLSLLNEVDPTPISVIDSLKKQLQENR